MGNGNRLALLRYEKISPPGVYSRSIYSECESEKDASICVMKGCPATAASTLRSLRTCSTCFSLTTSTFLSTFSAKTLLRSSGFCVCLNLHSHTLANVPVPNVCSSSKSENLRVFEENPAPFTSGSDDICSAGGGFRFDLVSTVLIIASLLDCRAGCGLLALLELCCCRPGRSRGRWPWAESARCDDCRGGCSVAVVLLIEGGKGYELLLEMSTGRHCCWVYEGHLE